MLRRACVLLATALTAGTLALGATASAQEQPGPPRLEQSDPQQGAVVRPRSARRPLQARRPRPVSVPRADSSLSVVTAPVTEVVETVVHPTGPHSFLNVEQGLPTRWNPCQPIPWQFNPAGAPARGFETVQAALETVSQKTGLQFRYDGPTATVPTMSYLSQSWLKFRPLLIGWSSGAESDLLAGSGSNMVGMARILWTGSYADDGSNRTQIASGVVALNRAHSAGMTGPGSWYTYVLHELGHAVGLGHVDDDQQLMRSSIPTHLPTYGNGDLQGLAAVGSRDGCLPSIR